LGWVCKHLDSASRASKICALSVFFLAWPSVISETRRPKPSVLRLSPCDVSCAARTQGAGVQRCVTGCRKFSKCRV
jgi:hypothetical protein